MCQVDHCTEASMWSDQNKFRAMCDSQAGLVGEDIAKVFCAVSDKCTQKNHKRRCNMDEVTLCVGDSIRNGILLFYAIFAGFIIIVYYINICRSQKCELLYTLTSSTNDQVNNFPIQFSVCSKYLLLTYICSNLYSLVCNVVNLWY